MTVDFSSDGNTFKHYLVTQKQAFQYCTLVFHYSDN